MINFKLNNIIMYSKHKLKTANSYFETLHLQIQYEFKVFRIKMNSLCLLKCALLFEYKNQNGDDMGKGLNK